MGDWETAILAYGSAIAACQVSWKPGFQGTVAAWTLRKMGVPPMVGKREKREVLT